ncbi:TIM barrel protein [Paenibacillus koleovorans]|uniref:TIM barrel protein n=1 Tax=Paenibacillus koleovorans TaxID=121608 RepID=UPI000FDBDFD4|nr:TIM barrel protein [Paenibacillus koleovorans]
MIWDRLGVISDEVSADLNEALDWMVAEGLRHVEIRMVDGVNVSNLSDDDVARVSGEIARRGLRVSAIASPLFKCALDPTREVATGDMFGQAEESIEAHFDKLDRTILIAGRLGTRCIRIFSFWREAAPTQHTDEIVAHLKRAAAVAERADVVLLLENERTCNGGYAFEVASFVRQVGSPALRALWDPGNESAGEYWSYPDVYREVKELLEHVHLKDTVALSDGKSRCVPLDSGRVPYLKQIRDLEQDGYKGLYVIETHYTPSGGTKMEGTKQSLEGLRRLLGHPFIASERVDRLLMNVYDTDRSVDAAAAIEVAAKLKELLSRQAQVRLLLDASPSQSGFWTQLAEQRGIEWSRIAVIQLNEYTGLPGDAPDRLGDRLSERLLELVHPGERYLIDGTGATEEQGSRIALAEAQIDIACVDIWTGGRIVSTIAAGSHLICTASGAVKRQAVEAALRGDGSAADPFAVLRGRSDSMLLVDRAAYGASL